MLIFLLLSFSVQFLFYEVVLPHCRFKGYNAIKYLKIPDTWHMIYSATGTPRGPQQQLSPREEFLLVLMRLWLGLQEQDLQYRFKLSSVGRVSKLFTAWMPFLARILSPVLMPWPSRKKVQKNMPPAFKALKKYRKVRIILDCSEFEMESPSSLALNAMSYSDYKGRTTVKVLFGVTPDGYVSFVSKAYGGAISDNSLTMKSGVLEKCDAGDKIMADKGLPLSNAELQPRGLATVLPPFCQGSAQFTSEEVEETKEIANLRIVVENCIMRIRYFRLLRQRLTVSSVKQASAIVKVCALLTNLRAPIRYCNRTKFRTRFNFVYFVLLAESTKFSSIREPYTYRSVSDTTVAVRKFLAYESWQTLEYEIFTRTKIFAITVAHCSVI